MSTKRQAAPRRGDRRRRPDGSAPSATRRSKDVPSSRRERKRGGTAPTQSRELRAPRSGPRTTTRQDQPAPPKNTKQAKARAKARKAKAPKVVRVPLRERLLNRLAALDLRPRTLAAKVPFVVLIIGVLGVGLGITLWLSTDAAERSYQLANLRAQNKALLQQKEALERDVLTAESAPELAEAARNLGMIPSRDTAHLVQDGGGNWVVVGTPKPAEGVPPPPLNTKLPDENPAPPPPPRVNPAEVPAPLGSPVPGPEVLLRVPNSVPWLPNTQHLPGPPPGPARGVAPPIGVAPLPEPHVASPQPGVEQFSPPMAASPAPSRGGAR